jgi:hypothetical protein
MSLINAIGCLAWRALKVDSWVEGIGAEQGGVDAAQGAVGGGGHDGHLPPHVLQMSSAKERLEPVLQGSAQSGRLPMPCYAASHGRGTQ